MDMGLGGIPAFNTFIKFSTTEHSRASLTECPAALGTHPIWASKPVCTLLESWLYL